MLLWRHYDATDSFAVPNLTLCLLATASRMWRGLRVRSSGMQQPANEFEPVSETGR